MDFVHKVHDVGIVRTDSSSVGLMLAKRKDGSPDYEVIDDDQLAEQRAQGTPGYGWFMPTKELPSIQDDWREGLGQYIYDSSSPKRYHSAVNMDLRFPNMAIAAPKATAVTPPTSTAPTITDAGLETWTDVNTLTNWTKSVGNTGSLVREATIKQAGTYSAKLTGDDTEVSQIYQDLATTQIQGRRFTLTGYVYSSSVTGGRIGVNDGVDTTYSIYNATAAWVQVSVTKTLSQVATRLRLICESPIDNVIYFDALAITRATIGNPVAHATFNNNEYIALGGLLTKLNATGDTLTGVYEFPCTIKSLKVFADGFLYIGFADGTVIEDCEDAWTQGNDVTTSADTADYKVGSASVKMVVAATAGVQIIAYENITSIDLRDYTGVTFWFKSSVALSANDWNFKIDDTAAIASAVETLNIPAISANVWTKLYLRFANAGSTRTDIISIGLYQAVDKGAMNAWIDAVMAVSSYYFMSAGEGFTQAGAGTASEDSFAQFLETNLITLWKSLPPNKIYSTTTPQTITSWSSATTVDSPTYNITTLLSQKNVMYIIKEDRPFYLTAAGAVTVLADDTKHLAGTSGGKNTITWQERLYMPYGTQSLVEYDEDANINWRDPAIDMSNLPDFDGQVQALSADERYLFAAIDNDTKVEILSGSYETIDSTTGWHWHGALVELTLAGCELLFVSNIYKRRLWICSTSSSDSLYYIPLYDGYGDPLTDTNKLFQTDGNFVTPYFHGDFKADNKAYFELIVHLGHAYDIDIYFEAHYQKANDTTWTSIGNLKGTSTNRVATAYIPVDASSNKPVSRMFRLKFVAKTDDTSKTPVLLSFMIRGKLYTDKKRKLIQCTIRGVDNPLNKQQQPDAISAALIKTVLDEANNATWPFTFYDPWNVTKTVAILDMREHPITDEKDPQNIERHFSLVLQEITLS